MGSPLRALALMAVFALAPLAAMAVLRFGFDAVAHESARPLIHRDGGYVGADTCRDCHGEHFESWERTFHSTMTQRASPESVLGVFDGRAVTYENQTARPTERDGRFYMEVPTAAGGTREAEVVLTVGSRRYQQYFEREERGENFAFVRLPILWHIEAGRWLHLNTVFLNPDNADWDDHKADWNSNCILCHNTGPQPGMTNYRDPARQRAERFDSKVAELGIACEACHGPGEGHASALRDPFTRYAGHWSKERDPLIVQPQRIDQERAVGVCGQCHGQRMPHPISRAEAWFTSGPTFRSGERLLDHVNPITAETPVLGNADPDLFRFRFWGDGTPRLTAYEYQGIVRSPCYERGPMTCGSCHTMHSGDVRGQLEPAMRTNHACTQCHTDIGRDVAAHTKHGADSSGSACLECHMPPMVYGVVEIHRSHRIEIPDAKRDAENGRPNACTLCHLDKSALWTAQEMARAWGPRYVAPAFRLDKAPLDLADSVASLLAGDAVQRAVYAKAMGRADAALAPVDKGFLRLHLAVTLGDGYPSVRWIAQRSLEALERELPIGTREFLENIDHMDGPAARREALFGMLRQIAEHSRAQLRVTPAGLFVRADFTLDLEAIIQLTNLQGERSISIGE